MLNLRTPVKSLHIVGGAFMLLGVNEGIIAAKKAYMFLDCHNVYFFFTF